MKRYEKCLRCGRKLKTTESQELGFGKTCWVKYNTENTFKELFPLNSAQNCLTINREPNPGSSEVE